MSDLDHQSGPAEGRAAVLRLRRISLTVTDLSASEAFYRDALGFEPMADETHEGRAFSDLMGIPGLRARSVVLRLGEQEIELVSFGPRGRDYPPGSTAADPWFQHFAIVVADMDEAYGGLRRRTDLAPISTEGPQRLPPNTGSVTAYKFRDPDGHPLELTMFPAGVGAAAWHQPRRESVFLGIDHSAISIADTSASIAFYRDLLGMSVTFRSINKGPEQERLDGLASNGVEITVLQPADPDSPHIELLEYRLPSRRLAPIDLRPNDVAATRLVLQANDLAALHERLEAAYPPFRTSGLIELKSGCLAVLLRDEDGHLLQISG